MKYLLLLLISFSAFAQNQTPCEVKIVDSRKRSEELPRSLVKMLKKKGYVAVENSDNKLKFFDIYWRFDFGWTSDVTLILKHGGSHRYRSVFALGTWEGGLNRARKKALKEIPSCDELRINGLWK